MCIAIKIGDDYIANFLGLDHNAALAWVWDNMGEDVAALCSFYIAWWNE